MIVAATSEQQYTAIEFAGMPEGWLRLLGLLLLLGVAAGVFWLYRREARAGASSALRNWLAVARVAALLVLALVWLEPVVATYTTRTTTARTLVMADVSASMAVADVADRPRIDLASNLLESDNQAWLRGLAAKNEVRLYAFGDKVSEIGLPWNAAGERAAQSRPAASQNAARQELPRAIENRTDLGRALSVAISDNSEAPIAGVVVITDGEFNQGMTADDLAVYARRFKAPVYAVGVGSTQEPPNLRISAFSAPATTARGDPFEVRIDVDAFDKETPAVLELSARNARDAAGESRIVARRDIVFSPSESRQTVRVKLNANEPGEFQYTAKLTSADDEAVTTDNERDATVLVLDERLRLLIVAGHPSYEYRYLTRLFQREDSIDVSCWLQSADPLAVRDGDTVITELPRRPEDIFQYDAILLLDPDPRELDSAWALTVRRLVDEFGGGVLLEAGPHYTSRLLRDSRLEDLIALLPAVPDPDADMRLTEEGAYRTRARKLVVPDDAATHPLMRLDAEDTVNRRSWSMLPGVWWRLPVLRAKPLATVLMRLDGAAQSINPESDVLAAVQPFGAGRAVFLGFDGTWRWRSTDENRFNRFWIQMVRYLAQPRLEGVSKRGSIVLDRDAVRPGDLINIEARVLDKQFVPWHEAKVEAHIELPDGQKRMLTLQALPARPGWFGGRLEVDWVGPAAIRVPLPDAAGAEGDAGGEALVKHVQSRGSDVELSSLRLKSDELASLSEKTGGEYVPIADASKLVDLIKNASEVRTARGADRPLWDNAWVMSIVAILLGVEWTLRRRNHLL